MTEEVPTILWDIDGTLLATGDGGITHFYRAVGNVSGEKAAAVSGCPWQDRLADYPRDLGRSPAGPGACTQGVRGVGPPFGRLSNHGEGYLIT